MPSFRQTLIWNTAIPFLALVMVGGLLGWLAWRVHGDQAWVTHTLVVQRQANLVGGLLSQLETGQRGYLLSGQQAFLLPYLQGRGEIDKAIGTLEYLVRDNPTQEEAARRIHAEVRTWDRNAQYEIQLKQAHSPAFLPYFTAGRGAQSMQRLRDQVDTFVTTESRLLEARQATLNRMSKTALLVGGIGLLLAAGFFVLFSLRQYRQLVTTFDAALVAARASTEEVARLNRRNELILDSSGEGIYGVDRDGRVTFINQTGLRMLGYAASEVMGQTMHALTHHSRPDGSAYPITDCPIYRAFKDGAVHHVAEDAFWRKDGTSFPVDYVSTPIVQDGQVLGAVVNFRDLSTQRTAEAERKRLQLEEQATRTKLVAAQELDRLKSMFVNSVSHELRTPLTAILGYAEFLEEGIGGPLSPDQCSYVHQIQVGSKRLERLVNDLLDYARIEAGTFQLQVGVGDIRETVQDIVANFMPQAEESQVRLVSELPDAPVLVRMDTQRVTQVFANLISNALKFVSPGGTVTVRVCIGDSQVRCEVEDTGEGIDPADIPKLFKRFSQLEGGVRKGGGTGLGLSISKTIVEAHGGRIGVESAPGRGALFWFNLPLHRHERPKAAFAESR